MGPLLMFRSFIIILLPLMILLVIPSFILFVRNMAFLYFLKIQKIFKNYGPTFKFPNLVGGVSLLSPTLFIIFKIMAYYIIYHV